MHLFGSIIVTGALVQQALAWGGLGHRTAGYVAYGFLSQGAKDYVDDILANDEGFDFGDAGLWADTIKRRRPETRPWHYINGKADPPQRCNIAYPDDCGSEPDEGCVISAIANQTAIFIDTDQGKTERKEALMFLVHLIPDQHQPWHTEAAYRGGNDLPAKFGRKIAGVNLHNIWDTYIPNKIVGIGNDPDKAEEKEAAKTWADELRGAAATEVNIAAECHDLTKPERCALKWARESNKLICSYAMQPSVEWLQDNDLSQEYYEGAKPIVEKAITQAGLRLAAWVEAMVEAVESSEGTIQEVEL